ncbi:putative FAD-binding protein [Lachnellula suecica]|uniref:Putative FAD-binding protein n=1 Tax=Lachnellula suecica TaxID=602035 RepID=A0A8T9CCK8_9HELO|nr:putative FAD-binding protein [Lachnellula suecica]
MALARPAIRQCLSYFNIGSTRHLEIHSYVHLRSFSLKRLLSTSTSMLQRHTIEPRPRRAVPGSSQWQRIRRPRLGWESAFVLAISCSLMYRLCSYLSDPDPEIFDPPRFTPFTIVSREEVSPTSIVLTLRPGTKDASTKYVDPYKEWWERGTWSVEVKQPQLQIARAYTPLPPREGDQDGDIRFLIRKEHKGEVSGYLHNLPVGGRVELRGPKFEVELGEVTNVVFLAGGTGIAPALQVIHTLLERRKGEALPKIHIVWANRRREDCEGGGLGITSVNGGDAGYVVQELQNLQTKHPENLQVEYIVDEEGNILDRKRISSLLNTRSPVKSDPVRTGIDSRVLFVSGPEGFVSYLAGPKRWEGGTEGQGELGGILERMGRHWKVWKL